MRTRRRTEQKAGGASACPPKWGAAGRASANLAPRSQSCFFEGRGAEELLGQALNALLKLRMS
jgi:hypothetical protein